MGEVIYLNDGLRSLLSGLGDPTRDKAASGQYAPVLLSDLQLLNAFRSSWIVRKLVNIPAKDALRKWRDWQAEQDQIKQIEAVEKRLGVQLKLLECKAKARLWGGAAIYIGTDQDPAEPFEPSTLSKDGVRYLTVLSRRELIAGDLEQDPLSENYNKPAYYEVAGRQLVRVHPSRLVIQIGEPHADPQLATGSNMGWGDSVLQSAYQAARNADGTAANVASLVFEANVDVFGVPGLMNNVSDPAYEKRVMDRFALAAASKGINRALVHDAEETFERKQISFAQLPEVMQQFLLIVSAAADIPLTRFLGQSPAGLSSTGEGDLKNYYDMVQSIQELELQPAMFRLDEALIYSALGSRPAEIRYDWAPLEQMSEKEISEIGERLSKMIETLARVGIYEGEELREVSTNLFVETGILPGLDQVVAETNASGGFDLGENDGNENSTTNDAAPRTLYVSRKVENAAEVIAWAKSQGFDDTLSADDLHVTIAFSRTPIDWMKIGEPWDSELTIAAGGPRLVEEFEGGAIVLQFKSRDLEWRHEAIRAVGASWDWPEYQPHITLTYDSGQTDPATVEPYQGEIVLGPEIFAETDPGFREQ